MGRKRGKEIERGLNVLTWVGSGRILVYIHVDIAIGIQIALELV